MRGTWSIYRFDHARYREIAPALAEARDANDLQRVTRNAQFAPALVALERGEISLVEARHVCLQLLCCVAEPIPVDRDFVRILGKLRRMPSTEWSAELLTAVLLRGHNLDSWLVPSGGITGFLDPKETAHLYHTADALIMQARRLGARRRRGGVIGGAIRLAVRLIDSAPHPEELFRSLGGLLQECVASGDGMAIIAY